MRKSPLDYLDSIKKSGVGVSSTSFIIVSVSDRVEHLNRLLDTIRADSRWAGFDINVYFQDPEGVADRIRHRDRITGLYVVPELQGCHGARVRLLREVSYRTYINLDDDMELCEHTNYGPAIRKTFEPGVGFVMTNWARTPELLLKKLPASDIFQKQIMLYNGGGMVYSDEVAELMRQLEPLPTAFDCAWPITAYVNGYISYRYCGSLAVHRVCGRGGMRVFMKATPLHVMGMQWLRFEPTIRQDGTCMSVRIPMDNAVKSEAKALHREARKSKGWA